MERWKHEVKEATQNLPLRPDLPRDPVMVGAWVSCLLFTMKQPDALAAFQADTGNTFTPGATPMERMIDEATGHERNRHYRF